MNVFRTSSKLEMFLAGLPVNASIGFVPTMGALHGGHKTLLYRSLKENDICVCSIFINPKQFENNEDLKNYPKTIDKDISILEDCGCQVLFLPSVEEVYPDNLKFRMFQFGRLDKVLEGAYRPGHFDGVAKVVSRLFDLIQPSRAYFGEKDAQQLCIVQSLKKQAFPNITIVMCRTIRESDGLAMSSRNIRLSHKHRIASARIYERLLSVKNYSKSKSVLELKEWMNQEYLSDLDLRLDYFEISNPESLVPSVKWKNSKAHLACIAVYAGEIRLIDNIRIQVN